MASRAARKIVEEYLSTRQSLSTVPSSLGAQLEALQNGLTGSEDEYGRVKAVEDKYANYAILIRIWACLTPDEQNVLAAQFSPIGTATYTRTVHSSELFKTKAPVYDVKTPCGGVTARKSNCKSSRVPGEARCYRHSDQSSNLGIRVTARGEEYIQDADEDGYCLVSGTQPTYPVSGEIASYLNMSFLEYRKTLRSAYSKIEANQLVNLLESE